MSRLHVERNAARILISDDHPNGRLLLSSLIKRMGYEPLIAEDGESCIEQLGNHPVSLLLLDINMPKKDGFEVLAHTREHFPDTQVVMVTGSTQIESAVKALKMGAYDYLTKPVDSARLRATVENGLKVYNLRHQVSQLQTQLDQNELFADIIGQSNKLGKVFSLATQVIETDITVLILGESGTGKELLAQAIHQGSNRRQGPFVPVNCAAVPAQLADSLFLGHKKGAFTGASEDQVGYFEQAEGGTLFLDEVGDMDINLQAKVLRVLEEKSVRRLGERHERPIDFRVICATNRDLSSAVSQEQFRNDLYFRLEEYPIYLPPLRERREDIPTLARHFLQRFCDEHGFPGKEFGQKALLQLLDYDWPGNIRELRNAVRRAALQSPGNTIDDIQIFSRQPELVPPSAPPPRLQPEPATEPVPEGDPALRNLDDMEREAIMQAYYSTDRNANKAAQVLGISRATMYRKLKKWDIAN